MTKRINTCEPVDSPKCRPGRFNVEIEFMFWTQAERFLGELYKTSTARLDVSVKETVGGFTVINIKTTHREGLRDVYDAYDKSYADFVNVGDRVARKD